MAIMKLTAEQISFLESLVEQGIELAGTHASVGTFDLRPTDVELFLNDPDQFMANGFGVSKETLLGYNEFWRGFQCIGTTKLGAQCKSHSPEGIHVDHPKYFYPANANCYCNKHKHQARNKHN